MPSDVMVNGEAQTGPEGGISEDPIHREVAHLPMPSSQRHKHPHLDSVQAHRVVGPRDEDEHDADRVPE